MNKIFLITRPKHDETTHYLFNWSKKVIELAKKKRIPILDLSKTRANKKELVSMLRKRRPLFVFLNGHGGSNFIAGHDNETLIKAGDNEGLLKSKLVYTLSCKSAKGLGPKSVKGGAITYMGYDDDFVFVIDQRKITQPLQDSTAKLFFEPSNQLAISVLKGHKTGQAYGRSQRLFLKNIQSLLTSEASPDSLYLRYLLWDMQHQVCLGDKEAVF